MEMTPEEAEIVRRLADGEDPYAIDPEHGCTNPLTGYFPAKEVEEERARRGMVDTVDMTLIGNTDAVVWAREFVKMVKAIPTIPTDEGTMIGWFANAIMSGYDEGARRERERDFMEKLHEVIYQAAGAATMPLLQDHPEYEFPSERVIECIEAVLKDFGIPPRVREPVP